tara:strand:- start:8581 stop:8814 length:234 start_codon:yes stop_codon:yes gene_type:complete
MEEKETKKNKEIVSSPDKQSPNDSKYKKEVLKSRDSIKKIIELKIELLKQTNKRKGIKKEIARLLTTKNLTKLGEKK